mmetsp:Transcript_46630/g.107715  ORF Transcript_46630/g.107715 Transcript_46630/m.107715 type:complete len:309 (-) Transcript_46630:363-1289(-)
MHFTSPSTVLEEEANSGCNSSSWHSGSATLLPDCARAKLSPDLQLGRGGEPCLQLFLLEQLSQGVAINRVPLLHLLLARVLYPRQLDRLPNIGEYRDPFSGHEWEPWATEDNDSWNPKLVEPEAELQEAREGVMGRGFSKCVDGVHGITVLESILDEASSVTQHGNISLEVHGSGVLEPTRYKSNVVPGAHQLVEPGFVQGVDTSVQLTNHLEEGVVFPQDFVNKPLCFGAGEVVESFPPYPDTAVSDGEHAVRVEAKEASLLFDRLKSSTQLQLIEVPRKADVVHTLHEGWAARKLGEPSHPTQKGQ